MNVIRKFVIELFIISFYLDTDEADAGNLDPDGNHVDDADLIHFDAAQEISDLLN